MSIIIGVMEEGLIYAIMALGLYITKSWIFRICLWMARSRWERLSQPC